MARRVAPQPLAHRAAERVLRLARDHDAGATALQRMPRSPYAVATLRVSATSPAFDVPYASSDWLP